jgi:hypothetical protein
VQVPATDTLLHVGHTPFFHFPLLTCSKQKGS